MVISGKANLTDVATGDVYFLEAGSLYTLDTVEWVCRSLIKSFLYASRPSALIENEPPANSAVILLFSVAVSLGR